MRSKMLQHNMAAVLIFWGVVATCGSTPELNPNLHLLKHDIDLAESAVAIPEPEVSHADRPDPGRGMLDLLNVPTYSTVFEGRYLHVFQSQHASISGGNSTYYFLPQNILIPESIEYDVSNNRSRSNTISLKVEQWNTGLLHHLHRFIYRKTGNSDVQVRIFPFRWMRLYSGVQTGHTYRFVTSWIPVQNSPDVITGHIVCGRPAKCEQILRSIKNNTLNYATQLQAAFKFQSPGERKVVANIGSDDLLRSPTFNRICSQLPNLDFVFVNDETLRELAREVILRCSDFVSGADEFVEEEEIERLSGQASVMLRHNITFIGDLSASMLAAVYRQSTDHHEEGLTSPKLLTCLSLPELRMRNVFGDLSIRLTKSTSDYMASVQLRKNDTESFQESALPLEIAVNQTVEELKQLSEQVNALKAGNKVLVQEDASLKGEFTLLEKWKTSVKRSATQLENNLNKTVQAVDGLSKETEHLNQQIHSALRLDSVLNRTTGDVAQLYDNFHALNISDHMLAQTHANLSTQLANLEQWRMSSQRSTVLQQRLLNETTRDLDELHTDKELLSQRIDSVHSALISESANVISQFRRNEQMVNGTARQLTTEIGEIRAKLENFFQAAKNNVDETAVAKSITTAMGEAGDQEAFVRALLNIIGYKYQEHNNIMIFNAGIDYEETFQDVIFFRSFKYGQITYFVWIFRGEGTFINKGRWGGWRNWGFTGLFDYTGGTYRVTFYKRP